MNLNKPLLEQLFNRQIKFRIPVFQRHYVWNERDQLTPLWEDFVNKFNEHINGNHIHSHYTGSIVLYHEQTNTSSVSTFSVIDGQQRLTTFQLLIAAFREVCRKLTEDSDLTNDLNKLLFNDKTYGDDNYELNKFKLEPTKFNKEDFYFIVSGTYQQVEEKLINPWLDVPGIGPKSYRAKARENSRILNSYLFFYDEIFNFYQESIHDEKTFINTFLKVLKYDFQFVEIGLTTQDDPQMIFETMNGRGAALTQTDLIRNYIFMRARVETKVLDKIYDHYWNEFDDPKSSFHWHQKVSRGRYVETKLQFFIIDYLTIKLQSEIRYDQVFYHYKLFEKNQKEFQSIEQELVEIHRYSQIFKKIAEPEGKTPLDILSRRLLDFKITTVYPLLIFIEGEDSIDKNEKAKIYKALDSYITRRFLCGLTTKNYNNVFLDYLKFIKVNKSAEAFRDLLKSKTGESNLWPNDTILYEKLLTRPIYREERNNSRSISNILLEIEHDLHDNKQENITVSNDRITVEHILPQTWFTNWSLGGRNITVVEFALAPNAVMTEEDKNGLFHQIQNRNTALHSIGNLTVLTSSLNPSVSNERFQIKRDEISSKSLLLLNKYFEKMDDWNEEEILKRSEYLIQIIKKIWAY